jgi:oligosaccharide repeat unit polymerase
MLRERLKFTTCRRAIAGVLIITGLGIGTGVFSSWLGASWKRLLGWIILLFIVFTLWPILMDALRRHLDPFEARNAFVLFFALYSLPLPVLVCCQRAPATLAFSTDILVQALSLSLLGLICFYCGYHIRLGKVIAQRLPLFAAESKRRLLRSVAFLLLISLFLLVFFLNAIGGLQSFFRTGYQIYKLEKNIEYLAVWANFVSPALLLFFHITHRSRTRISKVLFIVLLFGVSVLFFASGKRRYLFTLIFALLIYRHYAIRRFSANQVMLLGVVGFILMGWWGLLRGLSVEQLFIQQGWIAMREVSLSDLFYTVTGEGEFNVVGAILPQIIESLSKGNLQYLFGMSYLQAPVIFIPKLLYPNRPQVLSEWYVSTYYPHMAGEGGGRGFFFLAEAYLNFGTVGVVLLMFIAGIVFRITYSYLMISGYEPRVVLLYAVFISWIPSALRIDFATAFKGFVEYKFLLLIFAFLYSCKWHLKVHGRNTGFLNGKIEHQRH